MTRGEDAQRNFKRILNRTLVVPLVLMAVLAAVLLWQISDLIAASQWVQHTGQVIAQAHKIERLAAEEEATERGFLLTGQKEYLGNFDAARREVPPALLELRQMVADNPPQLERLDAVEVALRNWNDFALGLIALKSRGGDPVPLLSTGRGTRLMRATRSETGRFISVEDQLSDERGVVARKAAQTTRLLAIGLSLVTALILFFVTRRGFLELAEIFRKSQQQLLEAHDLLEDKVRARTLELEAANKELEAFSYSVSHDLRSPLRSIDGFSQALLEDFGTSLDPTARDYLARVRAATQKMGRLIDDLLGLSRLTRAAMKSVPVDLSAIAREILDELIKREPARKAEIVVQDGAVAQGDPGLAHALLENLLSNAWKFTSRRDVTRIEFGTAGMRGGAKVYFVRDNGAGFDMAYYDKLFGAFQRLHKVTDYAGTGIGLATVRRIAHRHGGEVWAESAVDRGTTFFFTLGKSEAGASEQPAA